MLVKCISLMFWVKVVKGKELNSFLMVVESLLVCSLVVILWGLIFLLVIFLMVSRLVVVLIIMINIISSMDRIGMRC